MGKVIAERKNKRFKVGDRVALIVGIKRWPAVIVEDRGFIGVGGRQLLRIRQTDVGDDLAQPFEVPADEVEHVQD